MPRPHLPYAAALIAIAAALSHFARDAAPALLAGALRRLYDSMLDRERPPVRTLGDLVDATWASMNDPRFKAVLEAWLAMANDPELRGEIGPVVAEFSKLVRPEHIAPAVLAADEDRARFLMARETLLGLALGRAINRGLPLDHEAAVLAELRRTV